MKLLINVLILIIPFNFLSSQVIYPDTDIDYISAFGKKSTKEFLVEKKYAVDNLKDSMLISEVKNLNGKKLVFQYSGDSEQIPRTTTEYVLDSLNRIVSTSVYNKFLGNRFHTYSYGPSTIISNSLFDSLKAGYSVYKYDKENILRSVSQMSNDSIILNKVIYIFGNISDLKNEKEKEKGLYYMVIVRNDFDKTYKEYLFDSRDRENPLSEFVSFYEDGELKTQIFYEANKIKWFTYFDYNEEYLLIDEFTFIPVENTFRHFSYKYE